MNKQNASQLSVLIFACGIVQLIANENMYGAYLAQHIIWALIIKTAMFLFVLLLLKNTNTDILLRQSAWLAALIFTVSCASSLYSAEVLYRYVYDEPINSNIIFIIMLIAVWCTCYCGDGTVVRLSHISALFICIAVFALLLSNIKNSDMSNLQSDTLSIQNIKAPLVSVAFIPPEALLLFAFCKKDSRIKVGASAAFNLLFVISVATIIINLAFGASVGDEVRPLQQLTRIGGIAVFRRLDALYVFVWLFAMLTRAACMLSAAKICLSVYMREKTVEVIAMLLILFFITLQNSANFKSIVSAAICVCVVISMLVKRRKPE